MGTPSTPKPSILFIGMLAGDPARFDQCAGLLAAEYGPVDLESPVWRWQGSDYYQDEMGAPLFRKFIAFRQLIRPEALAAVKLHTNRMESSLAVGGPGPLRRTVNLDPGYVTEAKVVLASTKDYAHRISIGNGIYAEVTLQYRKTPEEAEFVVCGHTYPDYRTAEVRGWFREVRERLRAALREHSR